MRSEQFSAVEPAAAPEGVDSAVARYEEAIERDFVHNALAGVLFEITWAMGMSFAIASVIIPAYLGELAAPRAIIGLCSAMAVITVPLQLLSERLIGGRGRLGRVCGLYVCSGLAYIAMGSACWMLGEARVPRIATFMAGMSAFFILINVGSPVYSAVLTDNSPMRRRGRLYGFRAASGGLTALIGLWPAQWVLGHFSGARAYQAAVIIAGSIYILSSLCPLLIRDHVDPRRAAASRAARDGRASPLRAAASLLMRLWSNANYRVFIFFALILVGSASVLPFVITRASDTAAGPGSRPLSPYLFQMTFLIATIINGGFIGLVADRWGYQLTLTLQAALGVGAYVLIQTSDHPAVLLSSYGLLVGMSGGMPAVIANLSVELLPRHAPAQLIAAGNVFGLPLSVALPWLGGWGLDLARAAGVPTWGYHLVFTVAALLALIGGLGTFLLVQEPRTGRVYEIKVLERM